MCVTYLLHMHSWSAMPSGRLKKLIGFKRSQGQIFLTFAGGYNKPINLWALLLDPFVGWCLLLPCHWLAIAEECIVIQYFHRPPVCVPLFVNIPVYLPSQPVVGVIRCAGLGLLPLHLDHANPCFPCWSRLREIIDDVCSLPF